MSDEFFIGWEPSMPSRTARFVRRAVLAVAVAVLGGAALVATRQGDFAPAAFAYGLDTTIVGTVHAHPVPRVLTADGSDLVLVGEGKHGAQDLAAPIDGAVAALTGWRIHREGREALEVHAVERRAGSGAPPPAPRSLGRVTLTGEIVDGKCWLGVMNPGDGKVHRACAARCISGGAPPLVVAGDTVALLVGWDPRDLLAFVAEPVRVTGELLRDGAWLVLQVDPAGISRL